MFEEIGRPRNPKDDDTFVEVVLFVVKDLSVEVKEENRCQWE